MKRLLNGVKTILELTLGFLFYIFAQVLVVIFYMTINAPLVCSILMSILGIGGFILGVLKGIYNWEVWLVLVIGIDFLVGIIYHIYYEILNKKQFNSYKRLSLKLTDEFQEMQIRYSGSKKDLAKIALEKLPYVFKARIILGSTIEYQFETKDGEIIYRGITTDYLWFEKNVYL